MIGNSPKSDIYSALAAGLHAVHVPHEQTWVLEHCEISRPVAPQQLVELARFAELTSIF
jgi:putative hydrolase of the HAD superfamily